VHLKLTALGVAQLCGADFAGNSGPPATFFAAVHCAGLAVAVAVFAVALARLRRPDLVGQVLCAGGDSRPQSAGPDAWAPRARLAVRSHEASSRPALACSSVMRVSSTRDLMSSLRNTWRRWNATVCVLMNS
jgi:hypothetical protein